MVRTGHGEVLFLIFHKSDTAAPKCSYVVQVLRNLQGINILHMRIGDITLKCWEVISLSILLNINGGVDLLTTTILSFIFPYQTLT